MAVMRPGTSWNPHQQGHRNKVLKAPVFYSMNFSHDFVPVPFVESSQTTDTSALCDQKKLSVRKLLSEDSDTPISESSDSEDED